MDLIKKKVIIVTVYRAPAGNFDYFLNTLDNILNFLHNHKTEFIICGDVNINYLDTNNKKNQLDTLLGTYNLKGTVYFPTRITNTSVTMIDNIFINNGTNYTIKPCINGLSDHHAQLVILKNYSLPTYKNEPTYIRNFNKKTIAELQLQLSWELQDNIFGNSNVNSMFNKFLNTYLKCYYSCFLKKEIKTNISHNKWITKGIKISCNKKRNFTYCVDIEMF